MDQAHSLRHLLSDITPGTPQRRAPGTPPRVIAVTSGKGGVGKTNITANLAVLAARQGLRVLIIDADLGLANVEIVFGLTPTYHIGDLLSGARTAEEVLVDGPHGIRILPAGSGVQSLTQLDASQKTRLVNALDHLEETFDLILVDSGAGIGDNVLFFVGAAHEAILVISPEPTSLVDAYAVVKVLSQSSSIQTFSVIVNPVVDELAARDIFPKLTMVTSRFLSASVRHLGYVPRDENLHRSIVAQVPLVDLFPVSPASRALERIASKLFQAASREELGGGLKFMSQRLFQEARPPG